MNPEMFEFKTLVDLFPDQKKREEIEYLAKMSFFPDQKLAELYVNSFQGLCIDEKNKEPIIFVSNYSCGEWWITTGKKQ